MKFRLLKNFLAAFILFLAFGQNAYAQEDLAEGKALFKANCASCHNRNMVDDLTGPALYGAEERWGEFPREDLYAWIRNSQVLISTGHPRANQLYKDWNKSVMTAFPTLTDAQIENVLAYVRDVVENPAPGPGGAVAEGGGAVDSKPSKGLYFFLLAMLALLAVILSRVASNLSHMLKTQDGEDVERSTIWEMFTSKSAIGLLVFLLVLVGGYTTVNNAISLGRMQGYQPDQPIKFSHVTHAGLNKIECQYCHDGARRSKHSVIPAANTCMNCHKAIKKGSNYGTAELTKIYASIGYNPAKDVYIDPAEYENWTEDQIKELYSGWIKDNLIKDSGDTIFTTKLERQLDDQWDGIKNSLTNDQKKKIQGPIEWIRIHNLPDHAYFNHAQHVSVGQVECQTCHGPVEEMEVVGQYSPLSMGWCINCHRQTEVKGFADNPYYAETYKDYHKALKNGEIDKVTVENIGGLECQKCHY